MSPDQRQRAGTAFPWIIALSLFIVSAVLLSRPRGADWTTSDSILALATFASALGALLAAAVAWASLGVLAQSAKREADTNERAWNAERNEATLRAYTGWSQDTRDARRLVTRHFGAYDLTHEVGSALATKDAVRDKWGTLIPSDECDRIRTAITDCLNGLERLAVGVEHGVYRLDVLQDVGGTVIARTYDRFRTYIDGRHTSTNPELRQRTAYRELADLVDRLDGSKIDSQRREDLREREATPRPLPQSAPSAPPSTGEASG